MIYINIVIKRKDIIDKLYSFLEKEGINATYISDYNDILNINNNDYELVIFNSNSIKARNIELDIKDFIVKKEGKQVSLTKLEYKILEQLLLNKNHIISVDSLINIVYLETANYVYENTIRVYIKRIRAKVGYDLIKNIKGRGYIINDIN